MAEEFQESDVVFSDYDDRDQDNSSTTTFFTYRDLVMSTMAQQQGSNNTGGGGGGGGGRGVVAQHNGKYCKKKKKKKKSSSSSSSCFSSTSLPVDINIPRNLFQYVDTDDFEEEYEDVDIIPPHVIVGRRFFAGKMAFSVCTGNGRTLKGRDLSQVRNSILRMTGFLET